MLRFHDYQIKGSDFWLANPRTYFAIDMGMGKTAIVLRSLTKIKQPALVVAPLRPVYTTWPEEIEKWNFPLTYTIIHGKDKAINIKKKVDVYITNYQTLPFIYDTLVELVKQKKPLPFNVCVIDEGSMIKSPKSKRVDYLRAMYSVFPKYRAILSGTPSPNSLLDLWSQYFILTDGEALGQQFTTFRKKHFTSDDWNSYRYEIKPFHEKLIYDKITPYTFRLDKKDYLTLPERTYNYIEIPLPKKLRKMYNEFTKEFIINIKSVDHIALNRASLDLKLRQFLQGFLYYTENGMRKIEEIHTLKLDILKSLVEETNQPILCAIQFKYELEMIQKIFPNTPIIAGQTSNKLATQYIKQWNKKEIPLLLCHPASLAHGVNLQSGGSTIIWYCQTWSLEQYQQFNERLYRQGQLNKVVVHHIVFKDTIDGRVTKRLNKKNMTQQSLLDYLKESTNY